ncbi:MAG TPA: PIN domain-containing protein [Thermoanaerobaculia bacterium]
MAILLDTGILYAYYDRADAWHARSLEIVRAERGQLIVPAPVLPEVDYLLERRLGAEARLTLYDGLSRGHYFIADLPRERYSRVAELNRLFSELSLGFVDAAVVAIGESLGLLRIATTDRRDFEPMVPALSLELLP